MWWIREMSKIIGSYCRGSWLKIHVFQANHFWIHLKSDTWTCFCWSCCRFVFMYASTMFYSWQLVWDEVWFLSQHCKCNCVTSLKFQAWFLCWIKAVDSEMKREVTLSNSFFPPWQLTPWKQQPSDLDYFWIVFNAHHIPLELPLLQ